VLRRDPPCEWVAPVGNLSPFLGILRGGLRAWHGGRYLLGFVMHADFGDMRHLLAAFQQQPYPLR
jgi:hypothetical protein